MGNLRIILDVDEVLADFTNAACKIHGIQRAALEDYRLPGVWEINETVCKLANSSSLTKEDFWPPIDRAGDEFWAKLELLPWADELLELVTAYTDDWHLVTSPSLNSSSYNGKVRWIQKHFGSHFDRFSIHPHKHLYANQNTVLIDDRQETVEKFIAHGGRGLVFPSTGNSLHSLSADPVAHVRRCLQEIVSCI